MDVRFRAKRKWSLEKTLGPATLFVELVVKKLSQHSYPCQVQPVSASEAMVRPARGAPYAVFPPEFWLAFDAVCRIIAHENKVDFCREGEYIHLVGVYHVNKYSKIKRGPLPPPF